MPYHTEHLAARLKAARKRKGFSQRALSARTGLPQAQISKIESAKVDLRLSSLVELARALELELMLVPRKAMPAVQAVIRSTEGESPGRDSAGVRPAYTLEDDDDG
ncbi:helix-turn-helix domain-containing protein [Sediminicurvatus halobius]|uniref:XRE family transcriptional regulator n=1 Tax=Sediminicurvatus halobius TaxID=2182432 RepID=A0A2U2N0Y9_9GAMM|nr:helix-turn-helix transcriptional regulator [Spiribacter halobius]PWG62713.1 XRE family transcriptional regulator [Spiribacter halobius]UEX77381.1 helix-turn-helix domain-containing protein [Spiribacter halobius]